MNHDSNYDLDEILTKYHKKSKHKIRIIEYDQMDSLYICSDHQKTLNEKYFSLNDCRIGEFVNVKLIETDLNTGSLHVQLGNCHGIIEKIFSSTTTTSYQHHHQLKQDNQQKIHCRIIAINHERNIIYLTNRSEYMNKNAKILTNSKQAKENLCFLGTIVKCTERFFIVKFFNNIKGILYKGRVTGVLSNELISFDEGQTMLFKIIKRDGDKLLLDMIEYEHKIGEICNAKISYCLQTGLEISIEKLNPDDAADNENTNEKYQQKINNTTSSTKGLVPIRLLSEYPDLVALKLNTFKSGDNISVCCIIKNIFSLRDVEYFQNNIKIKSFKTLQSGDILRAFIKNVHGDVVELLLPIKGYDKLLPIHLKMFLESIQANPNITVYPDQIVYVKVLSKDLSTKSLTVSAKLTDVWNGDVSLTGNYFSNYINELELIRNDLIKKKIPLGSFEIGQTLSGKLIIKLKDSGDWNVGLSSDDDNHNIQGIIKKSFISDKDDKSFKEGKSIDLIILWIDYLNEIVYCSHRRNDIDKIQLGNLIPKNLINKSNLNGKILLKFDNFMICSLKKGKNPICYVPKKLHYNDFCGTVFNEVNENDFCRLTFVHEKYSIAVLDTTKKYWNDIQLKKNKRKLENSDDDDEITIKKKRMKKNNQPKILLKKMNERILNEINSDDDCSSVENETIDKMFFIDTTKSNVKECNIARIQSNQQIKLKTTTTTTTLPDAADFWSTNLETIRITGNENNNNNDSSSEEDEIVEPIKKKKLTSSERFQKDKIEEARLRSIEEKYANPNEQPETADQFDRLVLSDPNNSKNWINYMVYHLQATEIDKARAIARKALKSISFREQDELINIWVALLNLELRYGTKESFQDIFKESLLCNDSLKIYIRVLEILTDANNKQQELIDLVSTITKKFKDNPEVWKKSANAYFILKMNDKAKQLMHRALAVLPEREHVNTIVAFANLHYSHDDIETGETLLEQVVSSYPKRVDVWSQYVDMLIKDNKIESARRTLERAVIQKIPIRKMRTLFKKYLDFEEKHGTEENVQKVKEMAANYVKNEINV